MDDDDDDDDDGDPTTIHPLHIPHFWDAIG